MGKMYVLMQPQPQHVFSVFLHFNFGFFQPQRSYKKILLNCLNNFLVNRLGEFYFSSELDQENMRGQRGTLRALAVICHSH